MADEPIQTYLLGAGASAEAGVPLASQMAKRMFEDYRKVDEFSRAMRVAIAGLKFQRSLGNGDPFAEIDIEDLYETLIALRDRHDSAIAPFVGAWSDNLLSAERPSSFRANARNVSNRLSSDVADIARSVRSSFRSSGIGSDFRGFEEALHDALEAAGGRSSEIFDDAARNVLRILPRYCWITDEEKVEYLCPLLRSAKSQPLWIATLNYDNAIELAAKRVGLHVDLGIRNGESSVEFSDPSAATLAKLHGSLDWASLPDGTLKVSDVQLGNAALIFGAGNKLQVDGPYLDLLFAFRDRLNETSELHVCGYSFRDHHINHLIVRWLNQNESRRLFVRDAFLAPTKIIGNIEKGLSGGRKIRLDRFAKQWTYEQRTASEWIASL